MTIFPNEILPTKNMMQSQHSSSVLLPRINRSIPRFSAAGWLLLVIVINLTVTATLLVSAEDGSNNQKTSCDAEDETSNVETCSAKVIEEPQLDQTPPNEAADQSQGVGSNSEDDGTTLVDMSSEDPERRPDAISEETLAPGSNSNDGDHDNDDETGSESFSPRKTDEDLDKIPRRHAERIQKIRNGVFDRTPKVEQKDSPTKTNQPDPGLDKIFAAVELLQGDRSFGNLLDAGTGRQSLGWIAQLAAKGRVTKYTAVTADQEMQTKVQILAKELKATQSGEIVIGNWFGADPLDEKLSTQYDTIIMDYLIGAMDGFSPYKQDLIIPKMEKLLKPGGRIYIIGLDPIPDTARGDANIICKVRQVRDACILLAGHRMYREYPGRWVQRQITDNNPTLKLLETRIFPISYTHKDIVKQINVGRSKLPLFPSKALANEMGTVLDDLEEQSRNATELRAATRAGRIRLGHDYLIVAEKELNDSPKNDDEEGL